MVTASFELVCWACGQLLGAPALPAALLLLEMPALALSSTHAPALVGEPLAAPRRLESVSLGGVWPMSDGVELSLFVTPTPQRCAPLLEMTF